MGVRTSPRGEELWVRGRGVPGHGGEKDSYLIAVRTAPWRGMTPGRTGSA